MFTSCCRLKLFGEPGGVKGSRRFLAIGNAAMSGIIFVWFVPVLMGVVHDSVHFISAAKFGLQRLNFFGSRYK